jgi:predicted pyridoxine 5'-phosphate oxidase superfamily flavin-nucleotide-binding protein
MLAAVRELDREAFLTLVDETMGHEKINHLLLGLDPLNKLSAALRASRAGHYAMSTPLK